jgi:flagellar basal-body rod protein FlgC
MRRKLTMSNLLPGIQSSASALSAERTRLDIIAQNIANSQTTRDATGTAYRRKQVVFETMLSQADASGAREVAGVKVAQVINDPRPFPQIYQPGHPHADAKGMVSMPNVNILTEMVDLATASRSFEANLQVISMARQIFNGSMKIAQG